MVKLKDITLKEFYKVYRELRNLSSEYAKEVKDIDQFGSLTETYTKVYLKLMEYLPTLEGKRILEIGSGVGIFLYALKRKGAEVYGNDKNYGNKLPKNGINFSSLDMSSLPLDKEITPKDIFPNANFEEFDVIISRLFLEDPVITRNEAERILRNIKPLSKLQIHESEYDVNWLEDGGLKLEMSDYKLIDCEESEIISKTKLYTLGRNGKYA